MSDNRYSQNGMDNWLYDPDRKRCHKCTVNGFWECDFAGGIDDDEACNMCLTSNTAKCQKTKRSFRQFYAENDRVMPRMQLQQQSRMAPHRIIPRFTPQFVPPPPPLGDYPRFNAQGPQFVPGGYPQFHAQGPQPPSGGGYSRFNAQEPQFAPPPPPPPPPPPQGFATPVEANVVSAAEWADFQRFRQMQRQMQTPAPPAPKANSVYHGGDDVRDRGTERTARYGRHEMTRESRSRSPRAHSAYDGSAQPMRVFRERDDPVQLEHEARVQSQSFLHGLERDPMMYQNGGTPAPSNIDDRGDRPDMPGRNHPDRPRQEVNSETPIKVETKDEDTTSGHGFPAYDGHGRYRDEREDYGRENRSYGSGLRPDSYDRYGGHMLSGRDDRQLRAQPGYSNAKRTNDVCNRCRGRGHWAKDCPSVQFRHPGR